MANDPAIVDTQTGVMTTWPVGPVYEAALSADGSRIAFISTRADLDPNGGHRQLLASLEDLKATELKLRCLHHTSPLGPRNGDHDQRPRRQT